MSPLSDPNTERDQIRLTTLTQDHTEEYRFARWVNNKSAMRLLCQNKHHQCAWDIACSKSHILYTLKLRKPGV